MRLIQYSYPAYRTLTPDLGGLMRSSSSGLEAEIDCLLGRAVGGLSSAATFPVGLREDQDHTHVRAELPGVKREDIGVEVTGGNLTITAKRSATGNGSGEAEAVTLTRTLGLGETVQSDKITAAYENGVLTITLPKAEAAKPRKIAVN